MPEIDLDLKGIHAARLVIKGAGKAINTAAYRAINATVKVGRTQASKEIRSQVNLKAGYVRDKLRVIKANKNKLSAEIRADKRPVLLTRYGAKQMTRKAKTDSKGSDYWGAGRAPKGVSVKVKKGGARKKMKGAFFIVLKSSGAVGVAVRTGPARGDIDVLHGPSVDQVFRTVRDEISPDLSKHLNKTFRRQLAYEMTRGRK